jgi:hypothetical protein
LANDAICLGNEDYEVFYYHSTIDAENDLNNTESIRPTYKMRSRMKSYMQKVQANATCYSMGSITLHANENRILLPETMLACDLGEGKGLFDLEHKRIQ